MTEKFSLVPIHTDLLQAAHEYVAGVEQRSRGHGLLSRISAHARKLGIDESYIVASRSSFL